MPHWHNAHHVRSFYLVAHHGGITAALPHLGYGIQQPALSQQMLTLEAELGVSLFIRKPFRLTPAGKLLYDITHAYHQQLDGLFSLLGQGEGPLLTIGASDVVCAEYLPGITAKLSATMPQLRIAIHCGTTAERLKAVQNGTLHLAIVALESGSPPTGLEVKPLLRLPLVLLAQSSLRTSAQTLLNPNSARPSLIIPSGSDAVCTAFDAGLKARGVSWQPRLNVSNIGLLGWFVMTGHGIGLTVDLPKLVRHPGLRRIPLSGFADVEIAAVWRPPATPEVTALVAALAGVAARAPASLATPFRA